MAMVTLRLSPQRAHVRTARLVAAAMARRSGVQEDLLDEVRLAVGEACARAVQLHERYGVLEPIVVELIDGPRFEVIVYDAADAKEDETGSSNGMPSHGAVAWDEPLEGGVGLALLHALVEDISIETAGSGTRVRMRWPTT